MRRSSLVSLGCLAPLALLLNCVGDEPAQQDAGADGSIADGNTADGTPSDGSPSDGSVVPLTGAFSSALILPDPTLTFGGLAPVTAAGDVAFGGVLSNVDGTIGINGDPYTSNGGNDMLVLRIAENNGYKWVKSFGGTGADRVNGVVVGGSDDVYVAGTLACATAATTIAIGSVTFTCSHMGTSGVIIKLDGGTGDPQWVQSFDVSGMTTSSQCTNSIVDPSNGNVAVSCSISGDFAYTDTGNNPHSVTHPAGTSGDVFVAELDPSSGKVANSLYYASASTQPFAQLAFDAAGDLHVVGVLSGNTSVFVPASNTTPEFTLTKKGAAATEGVAFKLMATTWAHAWDNIFSGTDTCTADSIAIDGAGAAFAVVTFGGTQTFATSATSAGSQDTMVVALNDSGAPTAQFEIGANSDFTIHGRLAIDASDAVVVAGYYSGTGTNGPKVGATQLPPTTSATNSVSYTAKLSHDLTTVSWAQPSAADLSDAGIDGIELTGVAIDPSNQQVVEVGTLQAASADLGDGTHVSRANEGLFVRRRAP